MKNDLKLCLTKKFIQIFILNISLWMVFAMVIFGNSKRESIKYFLIYHNFDPYSFSYITQFGHEIKDINNKKYNRYYKVIYQNNKIFKAEEIRKNKIVRTIYYNSNGRPKKEIRGMKTEEIEYGKDKKIFISKINGFIQFKDICNYRNDLLYKCTRYDGDNNLIYYTLFDLENWVYKEYDKNEKLIKSSELMRPGK